MAEKEWRTVIKRITMKKLIIVIVGIFLLMPLLSWGQQPSIGEVKSVAKNHLQRYAKKPIEVLNISSDSDT